MKMSCNGCRVLRKGCSDDCTIRPCLQWIKCPESQANATLFLAKFYGRAGLINLIDAGAPHLRPAIFWSLLYEACGRIVNPVYGSVGLLWAGNWAQCQDTMDAVFKGTTIPEIAATSSSSGGSDQQQPPPLSPQLSSLKPVSTPNFVRDPPGRIKFISGTKRWKLKREWSTARARSTRGIAAAVYINELFSFHALNRLD